MKKMGKQRNEKINFRRHSKVCPCFEHIRSQTYYYSDLISKLCNERGEEKINRIINNADPCFVRYLSKCAEGVLNLDVKLPTKQHYSSLSSERKLLKSLANPNYSTKKKKEVLLHNQKGGFLGVLAGIVASALGSTILKNIIDSVSDQVKYGEKSDST